MKNTTLGMRLGIRTLAALLIPAFIPAILSGCSVIETGSYNTGHTGNAGNTGQARREMIVTTRNGASVEAAAAASAAAAGVVGEEGSVDPVSAFGASTSGSIGYSRCSYSQLDEETGVMGAARPISGELDDGLPLVRGAAMTEYAGQRLGLIQHTGVLPADRTVTFALLSSPMREQFITITVQDAEVLAADYGAGDPFDAQAERIALDPANVSAKPDGVLVTIPSDVASAFGESMIALLSSDTVTSQCTQ